MEERMPERTEAREKSVSERRALLMFFLFEE